MDTRNLGHGTLLCLGASGVVSTQVRDLAVFVDYELSAEHPALFDIAKNESKTTFTQRALRSIRLAVHRGWAELLPGRYFDLAEDPR